jgi:hypothetical protein
VNGIVTQNPSPVAQPDPFYQRWESIGKAETWKTNDRVNNAGSFGPWPEEYE